MKNLWLSLSIVAAIGIVIAGSIYFGAFNIAADVPHWSVTERALAVVRDRSVAVRASGLTIPNLADPELISIGAEHYSEMCVRCHLAPGVTDSELRQGLYPQPPSLRVRSRRSPAEKFWIIKHGVKMSAMPAWGATHDDDAIWGMVAFLQQLPALDEKGYATLTGPTAERDQETEHTHEHADDHGATDGHAHHEDKVDGHAAESAEKSVAETRSNPAIAPVQVGKKTHVHANGEKHQHLSRTTIT